MQWLPVQGVAIVVAVALVNALRRSVMQMSGPPLDVMLGFLDVFATGLLVGFPMLLSVVYVLRRRPVRSRSQYISIGIAIALSTAVTVVIKDWWETEGTFRVPDSDIHPVFQFLVMFAADWVRYGLLGGLIAGAYLYLRAEAEAATVAHQCAIDSAQMAKQVAEARLHVLEAQIEPHFLFNALATVKRLFRTEPAVGDRMLDNLMRYLSVALPQLREPECTLGREAALAGAYLDVQQIRMGRRLDYAIDVPEHLRAARLPPMMLLTLVENAIKHGLNPLPAGGTVRVGARDTEGMLVVEVADTGRGFARSFGAGTGLANTRSRLAALYGDAAALSVALNQPRGVVATLTLPLDCARREPPRS